MFIKLKLNWVFDLMRSIHHKFYCFFGFMARNRWAAVSTERQGWNLFALGCKKLQRGSTKSLIIIRFANKISHHASKSRNTLWLFNRTPSYNRSPEKWIGFSFTSIANSENNKLFARRYVLHKRKFYRFAFCCSLESSINVFSIKKKQ